MKHLLCNILVIALVVVLLCGCGHSYKINIVSGSDLLDTCPKKAAAGETVTVTTAVVTDGDMYVRVNGDPDYGKFVQAGEYEFIMPAADVEIDIYFVSNGLA